MNKNNEPMVKQDAVIPAVTQSDPWTGAVAPAADIYETGEAFVLVLDMPGASKETIVVNVDGEKLTVKAPAAGHHGPGASLLYREIPGGAYLRSFTLGQGVDADKIDAVYEGGVLALKIFKSEAMKPREITIR
jgi:HSP20 family protein